MAVRLGRVDLERERDDLLGVLERNLPGFPHARRFGWAYGQNPMGPAWSWVIREAGTGRAVGAASVFSRAFWMGSRVELCGQVGDFAIDPSHRSLGPAVMLQRATFGPVDAGDLQLCYDCPPDARGMSTFRRLGVVPRTTMTRYTRLLRTDRQVARRLGGGRLAGAAARLGNAVLARAVRRPRRSVGLEIALHPGRFDEEFSGLDRRVGGADVVRARRAAEDLNWRYRDDPLQEYEVLTARRGAELLGFGVMAARDETTAIVDLFGLLTTDETVDLLDAIARRPRGDRIQSLSTVISGDHPLQEPLRAAGFRARSDGPAVVAHSRPDWRAGSSWSLTYSDLMA